MHAICEASIKKIMSDKVKEILSVIFTGIIVFTFGIPIIPLVGVWAYSSLTSRNETQQTNDTSPITTNKAISQVCEINNSNVLDAINEYRIGKGLTTLSESSGLSNVSQKYSLTSGSTTLNESQMKAFSDDSINYLKSFYSNSSISVNTIYGNNYKTAEELVNGWSAKPDLKAVLDNSEFDQIGLASGCAPGSFYGGASAVFAQIETKPAPTYSNSGYRTGAVCNDGSTSSATGRGACSWHGGVSYWLYD